MIKFKQYDVTSIEERPTPFVACLYKRIENVFNVNLETFVITNAL